MSEIVTHCPAETVMGTITQAQMPEQGGILFRLVIILPISPRGQYQQEKGYDGYGILLGAIFHFYKLILILNARPHLL